ncbi:MAG TPA: thiamine ABC transporter substrate-binding protein [Candidatus Thermoplasmatota archaeon]|nr:thiamine ABC transporter substrate-binding protein [Candidatus Thermoplasmatota archaeon]
MEYRLAGLLLVGALLAGCASPTPPASTTSAPFRGETLTILDHGAFAAFEDAKRLFENATGATVVHVSTDDSGAMLQRAIQEKGDPTFDVLYGIDNILWTKAAAAGVFTPYEPAGADAIPREYVFFEGPWLATPVDHGYIGVNVDAATLGANVTTLDGLRAHAGEFVTEDPRTSTPGLGFLLATIATYGEDGWQGYWEQLFANGALVTRGWTEAYEQHFSAGYGVDQGGAGDRAIVTSYTESPAYEAFFGRPADKLATPIVAPNSTFHEVQTMGIANGTKHEALAKRWIEFTLTPEFQALAAPGNAVYPVMGGTDTNATYGTFDPEPGTFAPADMPADRIGANLERWLRGWTDLCEQHDCA